MGFEEQRLPVHNFRTVDGVNLVVSEGSKALAGGRTIDWVELKPGKPRYSLLSPSDPPYVPPKK